MSLMTTKKRSAMPVDIDVLLQDTYLLVVQLRQGTSVPDGPQLSQLCVKRIEHVRNVLKEAGMSRRSVDYISHAQCALLDETILGCAHNIAHSDWASTPLQAKFFSRHQAGEALYEDMREVLREPAPDRQVLKVFQRVLMLGFKGRYQKVDDPEREQLLVALNAQVAPLDIHQSLPTQARHRISWLPGLSSPTAHAVAVGLLLIGVWWGLDHLLGGLITTLWPGLV